MDVVDKLLARFIGTAVTADVSALRLRLEPREDDLAELDFDDDDDEPPIEWVGTLWLETPAGRHQELDYPGRMHRPLISRLVERATGTLPTDFPVTAPLQWQSERGPTSWQLDVVLAEGEPPIATLTRKPAGLPS